MSYDPQWSNFQPPTAMNSSTSDFNFKNQGMHDETQKSQLRKSTCRVVLVFRSTPLRLQQLIKLLGTSPLHEASHGQWGVPFIVVIVLFKYYPLSHNRHFFHQRKLQL
jgi:hypothetical protein